MSQAKRYIPWWTRAAILAVVLGAIVIGLWALSTPAVPHQKSRELRKGMKTAEVLASLGKPYQVISNAEGGSEWLYGSPLKRSSLRIGFSRDERLINFRQDELGTRKIMGACYWGVAWAYGQVGATHEAKEMAHRSMCASMGWENLRFKSKNEADDTRLNDEVWKFFNAQGNLIPNYHAETWSTEDPLVSNVVVSAPSRKLLEDYLRKQGFIAE